MVEFHGSEVRELRADLRRAQIEVRTKLSNAILKTAKDIKRDAKIFVPVDTGNLKNSITSETYRTTKFLTVEIGPTANYGRFVEEGTRYMSPQPYMRPAFDRNAPKLDQAIAQAGEDSLR